jgi:dihydrofolate synthase/folylpolyglutamate synthase
MTLEELTPWLFSRTAGGVKWGLETTRELLAGVGDPHRRFRSLHVAGTNGKGSVAALCAAALRAAGGAPVGLYTSPHLVSFAERVRIDGRPAPEAMLVAAAERLRPAIERTGASFFEATTAMAFLCFAEAGVETAVVEVGLGGRLDATNVVDPLVTAVTNVTLDHTEYLGATIAAIAAEKAGIFKPGVPALTAETDGEVLAVLRERAAVVGAPFSTLDERVETAAVAWGRDGTRVRYRSAAWGEGEIRTRLAGPHQARNALLALELLALLPEERRPPREAVEAGFAAARWPGRLQVEEIRGTTWVLDVAHNPAGARALSGALESLELPAPRVVVAGILSDKHRREMLPTLFGWADAAILTVPPSAPAARTWDPEAAARWAREELGATPRVIPDLPAALSRASTLAPHGTVLLTGSFHTVGDGMLALGIAERV